jgi:hypothetical protein
LEEAENIIKNLSAALTGLNVETGKIIKRASILTGQLKKAFLSLILLKGKKITGVPDNEYTIYRLIAPQIRSHATQTMEIICWTCPPG